MVESTAAVPITTYIDTWAYDKNGTSLQGGMLDTIGLYPKERKKAELIFSDKGVRFPQKQLVGVAAI